jgi:hypothetical protein
MDKQLLKALDNLSFGLELLVQSLNDRKSAKSSTAQAIKSADFGKSLEQINVGIKSIKKDTQEILKNQQTIISMQKKKSADSKTDTFEGDDKKKEGSIKKGITMILLIAVAVLAIGLAFKIVGKIDFLSVVGLSIAILIMASAFEKIARIKMTIREAAVASLSLVMMSAAVTLSSWILQLVKPISFSQAITGILIMGMFAVSANGIGKIIRAISKMGIMSIIKSIVFLPLILASIALGIAWSSWALTKIVPIGFSQALTAILISIVFVAISFGLNKIMKAVRKATPATALKLTLVLPAIAAGITVSSWIMSKIKVITWGQALTAILIGAMFAIISFGMVNIVKAVGKMQKWSDVFKLPVFLTMISLAIAASAFIFATSKKYFEQLNWVTMLRILLLGVTIGLIAIVVGFAIKIMGKLSWGMVLKVPAFFTLLSVAIAASAFIFSKAKKYIDEMTWVRALRILLLGIVIGVVAIVAAFAGKIMGKMGWGTIVKIPVFYTLISLAIAVSAFIFAFAKKAFDALTFTMMLKIAAFGISLGVAILAIGIVMVILKKIGLKVADAAKGGVAIVIIAVVIMVTSLILSIGSYKKYPPVMWALGVAASLAAFGVAALLLGSAVFGPQALVFLAGLAAILVTALTIVAASHILSMGKYKKYPSLLWSLGVGMALGGFALGAILLGINVLNPFFWAGLPMIVTVAETIVEVADILSKGKYNNPGMLPWAATVALLYGLFAPLIIVLGAIGMAGAVIEFFGGENPFDKGRQMLASIAYSIVEVSVILQKGKYTGGPKKAWAEGISLALGAFAPVYSMLVAAAVMKAMTGSGGVGPKEFATAIKTVALGITTAAVYFAAFKGAFRNGPPKAWAEGVGMAIGAFAPVYQMLLNSAIMNSMSKGSGKSLGPEAFVKAIMTVSRGIIAAAGVFEKNKSKFEEGKYPSKAWGEGVGGAIQAFAPVYKYMQENSGWLTSGAEAAAELAYGVRVVAGSIADVAGIFSRAKVGFEVYPKKEWGEGIEASIKKFGDIISYISNDFGMDIEEFREKSSILTSIVYSMTVIAKTLSSAKTHFGFVMNPNWVKQVKITIVEFLRLQKWTFEKIPIGSFVAGNMILSKVLWSMANVAKILSTNKKYFNFSIRKGFVKNMAAEILDFNKLINALVASEKNKGLVDSLKEGFNAATGNDPVTKIAKRLITLAKGYDALASSLIKLSVAMRMLNLKSLSQLGSVTKGMTDGKMSETSAQVSQIKNIPTRTVGKTEGGQQISSEGKKERGLQVPPELQKKNQIYYVSQQLEKMNKILSSIEVSANDINSFLQQQNSNIVGGLDIETSQ